MTMKLRYVDMTQNQLSQEIKQEESYLKSHSDYFENYMQKKVEKQQAIIKKEEEIIEQKKRKYLECIKQNKQYIKEAKGKLAYEKTCKETFNKAIEAMKSKIWMLNRIKENLAKNQNYYSEEVKI